MFFSFKLTLEKKISPLNENGLFIPWPGLFTTPFYSDTTFTVSCLGLIQSLETASNMITLEISVQNILKYHGYAGLNFTQYHIFMYATKYFQLKIERILHSLPK